MTVDPKHEAQAIIEMDMKFVRTVYRSAAGTPSELADSYGIVNMPAVVAFFDGARLFGSSAVLKVPCDNTGYFYDLLELASKKPIEEQFIEYRAKHRANSVRISPDGSSIGFMFSEKGEIFWVGIDVLFAVMLSGIKGMVEKKTGIDCERVVMKLPKEYVVPNVVRVLDRAAQMAKIPNLIVGS
jgi:hypothetical protein